MSLRRRPPSIRILGVVIGVWLSLYTFFGTVLPVAILAPPGVLTCVWLGLVAWKYADDPHDEPTRIPDAAPPVPDR